MNEGMIEAWEESQFKQWRNMNVYRLYISVPYVNNSWSQLVCVYTEHIYVYLKKKGEKKKKRKMEKRGEGENKRSKSMPNVIRERI